MSQSWRPRVLIASLSALGFGIGSFAAAHSREGPSVSERASSLRALPLNAIGITAHYVASIPIPTPLRSTVYKSYCSAVGCNTNEINGALADFRSIADFFQRNLRADARPIDKTAPIVVPCDGTVVAAGPVGAYGSIRVKNVEYRIRELMGGQDREPLAVSSVSVDESAQSGSKLWYAVIHIRPENCHRFVAPTAWQLVERRRIEGFLLWLNPSINGLYTENERVAMLGTWNHGLFAMAAVGAAGRGSIKLDKEDSEFCPRLWPIHGRVSTRTFEKVMSMTPGDAVGGFRLGSAIVLVFEAPEKEFEFLVKPGDVVKLGQRLANVSHSSETDAARSQKEQRIPRRLTSRERFRRTW